MPENLANSVFRRESSQVYLGTEKVYGIQSLQINNTFAANPLVYIGMGNRVNLPVPRGQQTTTYSLNCDLINKDYFYSMITGGYKNIFVLKTQSNTNDNYCLLDSIVNSYNCRYSVGQIPQIDVALTAYFNAGTLAASDLRGSDQNQLNTISSTNYTGDQAILVPYSNSINLSFDNVFNSNRVQSFSINISPQKIPVYNMGIRTPVRIDTIGQIPVSIEISVELGNYTFKKLRDYPNFPNIQNLNLQINDYKNSQNITSYNFVKLTQFEESFSSSVDEAIKWTAKYGGTLGS